MMKRLLNILTCACALALVSCIGDGKVNDMQGGNTPSEEKGVVKLNITTRTESNPKLDYTLSIYKNEAGKAMLVRKYDSSKADMQKPEYIWLLEGNYKAVVESGDTESGITIHLVDGHYDKGTTFFQAKCPVLPTDTPDDVAAKVHALEYEHFPHVIEEILHSLD